MLLSSLQNFHNRACVVIFTEPLPTESIEMVPLRIHFNIFVVADRIALYCRIGDVLIILLVLNSSRCCIHIAGW